MFDPITLPFGARMLFNTLKLRPGERPIRSIDDTTGKR